MENFFSILKQEMYSERILKNFAELKMIIDSYISYYHYTNPKYQSNVEKMGFIQSMSRRGNCWDNAPIESFFGRMEDVVLSERHENLQKLWHSVEDYISFYNHGRYQKKLKKMTSVAYRDHLLWTA